MKWSRAALFVTAVIGSAAVFQQALTVRDRTRYPAPGLLVHVDGHQMHLQVRGPDSAGPTVVLEAGMGSFSPNWYWVQTELAPTVRSVAYDRAGLDWSRVLSWLGWLGLLRALNLWHFCRIACAAGG